MIGHQLNLGNLIGNILEGKQETTLILVVDGLRFNLHDLVFVEELLVDGGLWVLLIVLEFLHSGVGQIRAD